MRYIVYLFVILFLRSYNKSLFTERNFFFFLNCLFLKVRTLINKLREIECKIPPRLVVLKIVVLKTVRVSFYMKFLKISGQIKKKIKRKSHTHGRGEPILTCTKDITV